MNRIVATIVLCDVLQAPVQDGFRLRRRDLADAVRVLARVLGSSRHRPYRLLEAV